MTRIGQYSRIDFPTRRRCVAVIIALCSLFSLTTNVAHAQAAPQPIFTKQANFRIPFQFDAEEMTRIGAVEVQLHVSTNQGGSWKLMQTVNPGAQKFQFNAPLNGEYWFSVRTIDINRRPHPAGAFEPGLVVVVDDLPPLLTLDATPLPGGQLQLHWQATDDYIDTNSLRIEYLDSQIAAWQPISITPSSFGRTNWLPPAGQQNIQFRAYVADRSGNEAAAEAKATPTATTQGADSPDGTMHRDVPDFREPVARRNPDQLSRSQEFPAIRPGSVDGRAPLPVHSASTSTTSPSATDTGAMRPATLPSSPPVQLPIIQTPLPQTTRSESDRFGQLPEQRTPQWPMLDMPSRTPQTVSPPSTSSITGSNGFQGPSASQMPDPRHVGPMSIPAVGTPPQGAGASVTVSPLPVRHVADPLMDQRIPTLRVNSTSFRLSYEIQDIGPSGVDSVDIYITENGGRKWYYYSQDTDRQSPVDITVPADGDYGFAVRIRNGVGVVADPPQSHDPGKTRPYDIPEVRVIVDQTPPVVQLLPLQQQVTATGNQLLVSWKLQDDGLNSRPISLSVGASTNGPWEPITGWVENSGHYAWSIKTPAPAELYVRLIAQDAAGNSSEVISDRPARIDLSRPHARFLEVQPVPASVR
ncbi:MAG: hypothetical protein R3C01_15900 [Planctomycetaceae bacterium]